ncbi:MAG: hypothetical protein WAO83_09385 [Fuerstiella sp.]
MKRQKLASSFLLLTLGFGCGSETMPPATSETSATDVNSIPAAESLPAKESSTVATADAASNVDDFDFAPLGTNAASSGNAGDSAASNASKLAPEQKIKTIMQKLKPLQVMLGQWRGTTRRDYDGFKAVDNHEWIWDLQTDPNQPALKAASDKSPFIKQARLTWNVDTSKFELTATDQEGNSRKYEGDYTDPVHEIVGPDDKLHRVFRMELTQTNDSLAATGGEHWQIAFAQQENNRYLLEVAKRRAQAPFRRYDTVSTQREGTSFALSDSDYGDKTCIISQGLGTTAVSYKGKTYWVCCSGCKAAFEEDPALWIARAEKRAAEK